MYRRIRIAAFLAAFTAQVSARTIVVDPGGDGDFTNIQQAIDASAGDGDVVLVKPGVYVITEPLDFNRLREPDEYPPPPVKNLVVRSEAGADFTTIRMSDAPGDSSRASVVIFENGESDESVLQGFTLLGGTGTRIQVAGGQTIDPSGGGMVCTGHSEPRVIECRIAANVSWNGGGVYCGDSSSPSFQNCVISGNTAEYGGGFCCADQSSPALTECVISQNAGGFVGGGFALRQAASPSITRCTISGNRAFGRCGGGVFSRGTSSASILDCRIAGNMALWGGGLRFENESPAVFVNCLIYGNFAEVEGGGVYAGDVCFPTFLNCSISANSAGEQGGGVYCELMTQPSWTNCIEWGNAPGSFWMNLSHCLTDEDPHFSNKGVFDFTRFRMVEIAGSTYSLPDFVVVEPDYHLLSGSLAIDRGSAEGAPVRDIEGNERPCGGGFDIGAYEYCHGLERSYLRGDCNDDGGTDIGDVTFIIGYLFLGGSAYPPCEKSVDTDDNGKIEMSDAIYLLSFLFLGGPSPEQPFLTCGPDPTIDGLACDSFGGCVEP